MSSDIYIKRQLNIDGEKATEDELLSSLNVAVVLAEPGAGKTYLLKSLANALGVTPIRASIFKYKNNLECDALVIDALDEVAKIGHGAVDSIIVKAQETGATKIIFASRSAQWSKAQNTIVEDCFGDVPKTIRLEPLTEEEQRQLFEAYKPEKNFVTFQHAIQKVDLEGLLGNPQFLKIFADAYVNSADKLTSKSDIFSQAIENLATENNESVSQEARLPIPELISFAEQVFAKVLLSGATGISRVDTPDEKDFPFINALIKNNDKAIGIINIGLFKPSQQTNEHEPVHRIIAEYCAAQYLVKRLKDPADYFSMNRCLAIIAPNAVVRDDLRGLFAWMAAVGDKTIQEQVIKLDPYAIFSNGDPTRLENSSKKMLLEYLGKLDKEDPYFRASDSRSTFGASGFFTIETVEIVRTFLKEGSDESHLQNLLLELLKGSLIVPLLANELQTILLDNNCSLLTRNRANEVLISWKEHNHREDFNTLLKDKSPDSLKVAVQIIIDLDVETFGKEDVLKLLFLSIDEVYPISIEHEEPKWDRCSILPLVQTFKESDVVFFLNKLSQNLKCTCEKRDCCCREGKSSLIVRLLNQLFEVCLNQPTAQQVYDWTKSLSFCHFSTHAYGVDSPIIKELQENHVLRQAVHLVGFGGLEGRDEVLKQLSSFQNSSFQNSSFQNSSFQNSSSGLSFREEDYQVIIDYAFNSDNLVLWSCFILLQSDLYHQKMDISKQQLCAHMRKQAREKAEFNKVWTQHNRDSKEGIKRYRKDYNMKKTRRMKRAERKKKFTIIENQKYFDKNIESIKSGNDWNWLCYFAKRYLSQDTEDYVYFKDKKLPEKALQNCFGSFRKHVPTALNELDPCDGAITVLQAACLVQFRAKGHLFGIDLDILRAVKRSDFCVRFLENDLFDNEINRYIFKTEKDIEQFIREYIEPKFLNSEILYLSVNWFSRRKEFEFPLGALSLEWLERFPDMEQNALKILFNNVVRHGDAIKLNELIEVKVTEMGDLPKNADLHYEYNKRRSFWLLQQFFFIDEICCESREWLKEDKNHVFKIESIVGRLHSSENVWPALSAEKIYLILDIFIVFWPKVLLPSSWGSDSPKEETAYRLLKDIIWDISKDKPSSSIPILEKILKNKKFSDYHNEAKHILFMAKKTRALQDNQVPSPNAIIEQLDNLKIASVEDLRAFLIEELDVVQQWVCGGDTDGRLFFYEKKSRVDENTATKRIVNQLQLKCKSLGLPITIEPQLANNKRCDFTVRCNIDGSEKMLVVEVKGQWNNELYTAAAEQLSERYSIHPNAEGQGVFLVLWFGENEKIAGPNSKDINTPEQLKDKIIKEMPPELHDLIDVVVMNLA